MLWICKTSPKSKNFISALFSNSDSDYNVILFISYSSIPFSVAAARVLELLIMQIWFSMDLVSSEWILLELLSFCMFETFQMWIFMSYLDPVIKWVWSSVTVIVLTAELCSCKVVIRVPCGLIISFSLSFLLWNSFLCSSITLTVYY